MKEEVIEMVEVMVRNRIFGYAYFRRHSAFCDDKDHGSEGRVEEEILGTKEQGF